MFFLGPFAVTIRDSYFCDRGFFPYVPVLAAGSVKFSQAIWQLGFGCTRALEIYYFISSAPTKRIAGSYSYIAQILIVCYSFISRI